MRKILFIVIALLCLWAVFYYFRHFSLLSAEKEAEYFLQNGDYEQAVMHYTRALAANNSKKREERILYKLGLCCRNAGEKERSLDFFMRLLHLNPESSYRDGVQNILKSDADEHLQISDMADFYSSYIPTDVSLPEGLSLVQMKEERDRLYKSLVGELLNINNGRISHRALDLWHNLRTVQQEFENTIVRSLESRVTELQRIETKTIYFIGLPENLGESLKATEKIFRLSTAHFETMFDALNWSEGQIVPDGIFLNTVDLSAERLKISIDRFLDFYKNTKLFLIFVDKQTTIDVSLAKSFPEERVCFFSVADVEEDLKQSIGEILHVRSLWH